MLGVCKHHAGMYEYICHGVCSSIGQACRLEPESWPPPLFEILKVVHSKIHHLQRTGYRKAMAAVRSDHFGGSMSYNFIGSINFAKVLEIHLAFEH